MIGNHSMEFKITHRPCVKRTHVRKDVRTDVTYKNINHLFGRGPVGLNFKLEPLMHAILLSTFIVEDERRRKIDPN